MDLKISLTQLKELFASAAEKLAAPVRQLFAQLAVLTAHVERIEAKVDVEIDERMRLTERLDRLADIIVAAAKHDDEAKAGEDAASVDTATPSASVEEPTVPVAALPDQKANGESAATGDAT
jgi:hypothetical protein